MLIQHTHIIYIYLYVTELCFDFEYTYDIFCFECLAVWEVRTIVISGNIVALCHYIDSHLFEYQTRRYPRLLSHDVVDRYLWSERFDPRAVSEQGRWIGTSWGYIRSLQHLQIRWFELFRRIKAHQAHLSTWIERQRTTSSASQIRTLYELYV